MNTRWLRDKGSAAPRTARIAVLTATGAAALAIATGCSSAATPNNRQSHAAAALPSTITVGALLPLNGPDAYFGQDAAAGAQIAVNSINAKGGVDGKIKLALKVVDNQSGTSPGNVAAITNLISTGKNLGMVLGYGAAANVAIKPYLVQHNLIGFNAGSNDSALSGLTRQWFNLAVLSPIEMHAFAEYLIHVKHYKTAGILGQNDSIGQGQDWSTQFSKEFKAVGGKIVSEEMASESATTFQPQVAQVKSANPQVVFLAAPQSAVTTLMTEVRAVGWNVPVTTDSNFAGDAAFFQSPAAQGLLSTGYQFTPPKSFSAQYTKLVGKAAGPPYSAIGNYYAAVEMYAAGLKYAIAHKLGTSGPAVANAIRKIGTFAGLPGGSITIDKSGNATRPVAVYKVVKGKEVLVTANAAGTK